MNTQIAQQLLFIVIGLVLGALVTWIIAAVRLSKAKKTTNELTSEITNLQVEIGNLQADLKGLSMEQDRSKMVDDSVVEERDRLKDEHDRLLADLASVTTERDDLMSKFVTASGERDGLRTELDSLRIDQNEMRSELEMMREQSDRLRAEIETTRNESDRLKAEIVTAISDQEQLKAASKKKSAELDYLRALFLIPASPVMTERNGLWSSLAASLEPQLARLAREARAHALAVGSVESALPIVMEGIDESTARMYVASATTVLDAGEAIARGLLPAAELMAEPYTSQVAAEIGDNLLLRIARLDAELRGLFLVSVGPIFGLGDGAWGRTLMTMYYDSEGDPIWAWGQTNDAARQADRIKKPDIEGCEIPPTLAEALGRSGISSLAYLEPGESFSTAPTAAESDQNPFWIQYIHAALRRLPDASGASLTLRVRPRATPIKELVLTRLENNAWLIARRDVTRADPSRLLEQVEGYVQFQKRSPSP